jgi:hypothetical protein
MVEGIVRLRKVAFGFELLDDVQRYLRPLLLPQPVHEVV